MARWLIRGLLLSAGVLLAAAPAPAQEGASVTARATSTFDPSRVTIAPGQTVTWTNSGGFHNVKFDDGSFEDPPSAVFSNDPEWQNGVSRRFDQEGTFRYYCEAHGAPNGVGMSGTVVVSSGSAAPPPGGDVEAPEITDLRATPARLCNVRRCVKRGTRFRFGLSEPADIEGTVRRRGVRRGIEASGEQGANSIRFAGRGLKPGRYRLTLRATDSAGNESEPARLRFRVVRP